MKRFCYFLILSIIFNSCYSYKTPIENTEDMLIGKHYKMTFEDGTVKRFKYKDGMDSLKIASLFFDKNDKIALSDAMEIKEGKFSIFKTSLIAVVTAIFTGLFYTALDFPLDTGGNFQL